MSLNVWTFFGSFIVRLHSIWNGSLIPFGLNGSLILNAVAYLRTFVPLLVYGSN